MRLSTRGRYAVMAMVELAARIVDAVDEPIRATRCEDGASGCVGGRRCITHDLWAELGAQIHLFLAGLSLQDVVQGDVLGRAVAPRRRELTRV